MRDTNVNGGTLVIIQGTTTTTNLSIRVHSWVDDQETEVHNMSTRGSLLSIKVCLIQPSFSQALLDTWP